MESAGQRKQSSVEVKWEVLVLIAACFVVRMEV